MFIIRTTEILLYLIIHLFMVSAIADGHQNNISFNRSTFPPSFIFGLGSSAYQYEGATAEGGRKPCIWDTYIEKFPGKVHDHSNATIASDQYHRYKEDVAILKDIGVDVYRFSISWSRVLPYGGLRGGVNLEGINYYDNLINELLSNGIKPVVTLFHWDLPQALEDEYEGFLSPKIVDDFRDYAELCFSKFGNRVKLWTTLNEPLMFTLAGYTNGNFPPGRCSDRATCPAGDSSTEPYIVAHHLILAHAAAVKVYKEKFQELQKGQIGISLNAVWMVPYSNSSKDEIAAARTLAFMFDWFMEPLYKGSYPSEMIAKVGKRLPEFSEEESKMVKGSYDFVGVNYYTSRYAADVPCPTQNFSYSTDSCSNSTISERNGIPIGPHEKDSWVNSYPEGLLHHLLYIKNKFNDPTIYITENGVDDKITSTFVNDTSRIEYIQSHLARVEEAMRAGVKVQGYIAWSFLDNFEWTGGFTSNYGLVYVDRKDGLKRYPKQSAFWFKRFLSCNN